MSSADYAPLLQKISKFIKSQLVSKTNFSTSPNHPLEKLAASSDVIRIPPIFSYLLVFFLFLDLFYFLALL